MTSDAACTGLWARAAARREAVAGPHARGHRQAEQQEHGQQHFQRIERHHLEDLARLGMQPAPERQVQRRHDHRHRGRDGGHRDRQRRVALGVVGEEVGDVAARTGRHQHHAQCDAGRGPDRQHEQEGERRQQHELPGQPDQDRLRRRQHGPEVRPLEVQRDAEHHQADDDVQRPQRLRIEVQPDEIHLGHVHSPESQPFGSSCIFLKWISPGAHMCLTGIDIDMDHRAPARRERALQSRLATAPDRRPARRARPWPGRACRTRSRPGRP